MTLRTFTVRTAGFVSAWMLVVLSGQFFVPAHATVQNTNSAVADGIRAIVHRAPAVVALDPKVPAVGAVQDPCAKAKILKGTIDVLTGVLDMDRSPPAVTADVQNAISDLKKAITALNCP